MSTIFVIARDIKNKRILLGGVGFAGVGTMWFDESSHHVNYAKYDTAKIAAENEILDDIGLLGQKCQ